MHIRDRFWCSKHSVLLLTVTTWCLMLPASLCVFCTGDRPLFEKEDKPRGTFFGYVALSEPQNPPVGSCEGRDVALVWRGTQFKEEWESNFCENQLVR